MADKKNIRDDDLTQEQGLSESRREFLVAAKKWSKAVVAGAVFGTMLFRGDGAEARAWANRRGGGRRGAWGNGSGKAWGNGSRRAWGNGSGGAWGNGGRRAWGNGSGAAWGNGGRRAWGNGSGGAWGNHGRSWANRN